MEPNPISETNACTHQRLDGFELCTRVVGIVVAEGAVGMGASDVGVALFWCERAAGNKVRILALVLGQPSIAWALPVPEGKFQLVQEAQPIETILEAKGPPLFLQANCSVDGGREGRSHGCD